MSPYKNCTSSRRKRIDFLEDERIPGRKDVTWVYPIELHSRWDCGDISFNTVWSENSFAFLGCSSRSRGDWRRVSPWDFCLSRLRYQIMGPTWNSWKLIWPTNLIFEIVTCHPLFTNYNLLVITIYLVYINFTFWTLIGSTWQVDIQHLHFRKP